MKTFNYLVASGIALVAGAHVYAQAPPADSLTLDKAIAIAMSTSPAVRQASEGLAASQARTRQAESARYPHVEADVSYRRVDPTITVDFPVDGKLQAFSFFPNDNYEAAITGQQTIYDFGRNDALENLARSGETSAAHNSDQVKLTIAYQTVQAFNTALLLQKNIQVLDDQIKALQDNLSLAKERLSQGTATNYDVLTTQVRLTTVQNQRVDVLGTLRKQEAGLRRLLGYAPSAPLRLSGAFSSPAPEPSADSLLALALQLRPEVVNARDAANTARLQVQVARTNDNPLLSLNVSGGVKNGFPPDLNAPKLNWAGMIHLAVPLFDGNRTTYMEQEAQANLNAADARVTDLENGIAMEVEQAQADLETNALKIPTADLLVEQASEALALARTRYKNGVITSIELLNAQTALQEAQFQRLQYQYNYMMSGYGLQRALGVKIW